MEERQSTNPLYLIYLLGAAAALLVIYFWFSPRTAGDSPAGRDNRLAINPPKAAPVVAEPTVASRRTPQSHGRLRVGVVAGHKGNWDDPGAVCPDGLTEAAINLGVAEEVVRLLEAAGIRTDLLDEFDDRQVGYAATALISIHTDSCEHYPDANPPASGFKVASLEGSTNPANRLLVDCLVQAYGERTGLPFHANSITYDMTQYHVFDTISPQTPGAIIEVGFMYDDRVLLTQHQELLARGIVDGLQCFFNASRGQGN